MELTAWPETDEQGRQFVFADAKKGVSKNTHGDTSGAGLIAVAVFTEGAPKPVRLNRDRNYFKNIGDISDVTKGGEATMDSMEVDYERGLSDSDDPPVAVAGAAAASEEGTQYSCSDINIRSSRRYTKSKPEEKLAVGAGGNVEQIIKHATKGLTKPVFDRVIQFKYELKKKDYKAFPGDKKKKVFNNDLKNVPRA